MNNLEIFKSEEFGEMRTLTKENEPWFCLRDVCRVLEIGNPSDAKRRLNPKGVDNIEVPTNGGRQPVFFINEGNLYKLILQSRKPQATTFSDWVTDEVLPSIRKHGAYLTDKKAYDITHDSNSLADLLLQAGEQLKQKELIIREKEEQITVLEPKAEFFDAVADSRTAVPMGDVAKILDMGMGRNKLFEFLRKKKVLMRDNRPYQKYVDCGYFNVVEVKFTKPDGEPGINIKTLVYQKGIDYIRKLLNKDVM